MPDRSPSASAEAVYRALFVLAPHPMLVSGRDGRIVDANAAYEALTGHRRDDLVGSSHEGLVDEASAARVGEVVAAMAGGDLRPATVACGLRTASGETVDVEASTLPLAGPDEIERIVVTFRDLTHLQTVERALRMSEERVRALVETASDAVELLDREGRFLLVNPAHEALTGYAAAELAGRHFRMLIDPSELDTVQEHWGAKLAGEASATRYVSALRAKDGTELPVEIASHVVREDGEPVAVVAILRDLRERQAAEHALLESEERFRVLSEAAQEGVVMHDDGIVVEANRAFAVMLGFDDAPELEGRDLREFFGADTFDRLRAGDAVENDQALEIEFSRRDGSAGIAVKRAHEMEFRGRRVRVAAVRDVTEERRLGRELREQGELQRLVIDNARDLIVVFDSGGIVQLASSSAFDLLGIPPGDAVGRPLAEFVHPDDIAGLVEAIREATQGRQRLVQARVRHRDGGWRMFEGVGTASTVDGRTLIVTTARDITDDLLLQEQLRRAQKLEAVGRLVAGIAHDFNNLLTAINGYAEVIQHRVDGRPEAARLGEPLAEITTAGARAAELTAQLLAFSRQQAMSPEMLDVNEVMHDLVGVLDRLVGDHVSVATGLEPGLGTVYADRVQLGQVLMNLVVNAGDAMPDGGTVTVSTENVEVDELFAAHHVGLLPGPYVRLSVSDTGVGMAPAELERIFEPFYTTKEVGRGTGLGLATVHGIVEQSGGAVTAYSEPGVGTTLRVYLPRVAGGPAVRAGEPAAAAGDNGRTVLVVEDEVGVRRLVCEMLSGLGYRVVQAASGDEALELVERGAAVDVLCTDVIMPGMTGPELVRRLSERAGPVRVVFTSGYTGDVVESRGGVRPGEQFLSKPFTRVQLDERIRAALQGPPPLAA